MLAGKPSTHTTLLKALLAGCLLMMLGSCVIVKQYQPNKPFVFESNVKLIGKFSKEEKEELTTGLERQLDDSIQVRKLEKLAWSVLKRPPVYDSTNADNSVLFMKALLKSFGYFQDSIYYVAYTPKDAKNKNDGLRTVVDFYVRPGKPVRLDSIGYKLRQPELQQITDTSKHRAFIKKGDPFAKAPISAELDRLTENYRNNGYFRFNRDELVAIWDTLDVSLLQPGLDPFEQLEILQKLRERRENPTANLEIRLKTYDSARLVKFYMGNVTIYPDNRTDTIGRTPRIDTVRGGIAVIQHYKKFKPWIFPDNIYLPRDSVYRQRRYIRTINRLNLIGAWRLVTIDQIPRSNTDTVDFVIRLNPAAKYSFNTNLEGSINQSVISGNLFGIGVNAGVQNRNFARAANLASTNLRYGIELGSSERNQFIQTQQVSFSHTIYFPRYIRLVPFLKVPENRRDNYRTVFTFNAANTERRLLYNLTTLNGSFGYEYQRRKLLLNIKIPNIEYSHLVERDSLSKLIVSNPSLRNIFTDGFISSIIGNLTLSGGTTNRLNIFRANVEESGILTGMIRNSFLDEQLYRFIKVDVEFAHLIRLPKSSVALRAFAGVGYEFDFTRNPTKRYNLPFFKQYFSGGPNSMRAWALRRLGPGSTVKEFSGVGSTPDRYGDIQLEANAEYRFPIGKPFGVKVNGAFFTDIGNVWYLKSAIGRPEDEIFKFSRLGQDIAIGAGGGLRIDFNFFVIRFDYSYKVKDPSPSVANAQYQNRWFSYPFFKGSQFQLGIGYPFIF